SLTKVLCRVLRRKNAAAIRCAGFSDKAPRARPNRIAPAGVHAHRSRISKGLPLRSSPDDQRSMLCIGGAGENPRVVSCWDFHAPIYRTRTDPAAGGTPETGVRSPFPSRERVWSWPQ